MQLSNYVRTNGKKKTNFYDDFNCKHLYAFMNYHPFTGRMRKRESKPIAPWKTFPPVKHHFRLEWFKKQYFYKIV